MNVIFRDTEKLLERETEFNDPSDILSSALKISKHRPSISPIRCGEKINFADDTASLVAFDDESETRTASRWSENDNYKSEVLKSEIQDNFIRSKCTDFSILTREVRNLLGQKLAHSQIVTLS